MLCLIFSLLFHFFFHFFFFAKSMTWKIVNVLAVVFCGVIFLSCMLVAPQTPWEGKLWGRELHLWKNRAQTSMSVETVNLFYLPKPYHCRWMCYRYCEMSYFTVVLFMFLFACNSMMRSGDSLMFPVSDISLLVRDCNDVYAIYYSNDVL